LWKKDRRSSTYSIGEIADASASFIKLLTL
jgi:hypothetical protein